MDALDAAFGATEGAVVTRTRCPSANLRSSSPKYSSPVSPDEATSITRSSPGRGWHRAASAVIAMAGVEDCAVGELTLHRYGALLGSAENISEFITGRRTLRRCPPRSTTVSSTGT